MKRVSAVLLGGQCSQLGFMLVTSGWLRPNQGPTIASMQFENKLMNWMTGDIHKTIEFLVHLASQKCEI